MARISIVGYEQEGNCEHCGRPLKNCIKLSDGRIVGSTCFDKKLTAPKNYQGKKYRIGSSEVVRLAKIAEYVPVANWQKQYGISANHLTFELA